MNRLNKQRGFAKRAMAFLLCSSMLVSMHGGMGVVRASEMDSTTEASTTTEATEESKTGTGNTDDTGKLGKDTDVGIEVAKSVTSKAGKKTKISFKLKSLDKSTVKLKNVYPVIDSSFPFETSGDAYKVVKAGDKAEKQAALSATFTMTARSDMSSGYHAVKFIGEYTKLEDDGTQGDYYVVKTINIFFEDEEDDDKDTDDDSSSSGGSSSSFTRDDDTDDQEVVAPKLILTGMETDPERIMAGDTFKLKIHVQNTSKTTPVCNGKFLIGNEAGNFLPTSGSSAVYVEKIPAGETGDLEIEMKTAADLPQKNYILVVKGDFDDGKGNNFTSSDNLSITVYQEVKIGVSDISMSPESLGIGSMGSLMFTINNQGSAGVYNVRVSVKDGEAVTAEESYVGNIAASSSAYATLNVTGAKDNSDSGSITAVITYEDSEGNAGKMEQKITCNVGEGMEVDDWDGFDEEDYEDYEDEGIAWWVYLIIALGVVALIVLIILIVVKKKRKRAQLLAEEDDDDLLDDDLLEEDGDDWDDEEDAEDGDENPEEENETDQPEDEDGETQMEHGDGLTEEDGEDEGKNEDF